MILIIKNILGIITDPKNTRMFLLGGIGILLFLLLKQCNETEEAKGEVTRFQNNLSAANDTILNYVNEKGESVGEIKGLSLSLEELKDSLKYEQGRPPITIVKYKTIIEERIIEVPVITKDTVIKQGNNSFNSILSFNSDSNWIKSSRSISVDLPYSFIDSLTFGSATVGLKQNIWLDATLSQDISTKEIFIKLTSDYPGTTFNSTKGIMIDKKSPEFKSLQMQNRKPFGFGLNMGIGIVGNGQLGPYIGLGVSWNPKLLQW
jgi:hypothetical protein|tara:strand:+ start:1431 stop:2216 length:786 start_codon:yes stop_codon:yes gene_type:complete